MTSSLFIYFTGVVWYCQTFPRGSSFLYTEYWWKIQFQKHGFTFEFQNYLASEHYNDNVIIAQILSRFHILVDGKGYLVKICDFEILVGYAQLATSMTRLPQALLVRTTSASLLMI